jgi:hypothetical protein
VIKRIFSWLTGAAFGLALLLPQAAFAQTAAKPFSNEQLEQMTAPVALYPDSLLAQLFMATTYPDDFAAAAAWSKSHPNDKGDAAVKLVENQPWDPSVASLVAFPEVLITFGDKPDWVRNMGDAFLAQPEDVMNAVQRLRQKAQQAGNLKSNEEIKVSTQKPEAPVTTVVQQSAPPAQVIVIEPAQPSVVYVPAYNPAYVYGPWPYPAYPPYYYPPASGLLVLPHHCHRHCLGHRHRHQQRAVGRLQLGPWQRECQCQPLQQHQREPADQRQRQPVELEPQPRASWQYAVPRRGRDPSEP